MSKLVTGNFDTCFSYLITSNNIWWSNFFLLLQRTSFFSDVQCGRLASHLLDVYDTCKLVRESFHNDRVKSYTSSLLTFGLFYDEKLRV